MERVGGFVISVYDQRTVEDNAEETFGSKHGDPVGRAEMIAVGFIDAQTESITKKGWEQLSDDIAKLETNSVKWLKHNFEATRADGHDNYDDLVGTFWFDLLKLRQVELVELGIRERIDMNDTSYGDLGDTVWDGVSSFGASILGGSINFNLEKDVDAEVDDIIYRSGKRYNKRVKKKQATYYQGSLIKRV